MIASHVAFRATTSGLTLYVLALCSAAEVPCYCQGHDMRADAVCLAKVTAVEVSSCIRGHDLRADAVCFGVELLPLKVGVAFWVPTSGLKLPVLVLSYCC